MHQLPHRPIVKTPVRWWGGALVGVAALTLAACSSSGAIVGAPNPGAEVMTTSQPLVSSCAGVAVVVDFGILNESEIETCVDISAEAQALDVLSTAGVTVAGTDDYGTAVVCRVNDAPASDVPIVVEGYAPHTESCASMPPEFAYWAVWVKQGTPDWQYAMVGAGDLTVRPGDSLGLAFTTGTTTPTPN